MNTGEFGDWFAIACIWNWAVKKIFADLEMRDWWKKLVCKHQVQHHKLNGEQKCNDCQKILKPGRSTT